MRKDSHVWFRNRVVTLFDDHDQVRKGSNKARFCAGEEGWKVVSNALALNLCSLGIPCVYYGTEQYFNGAGDGDRYLRECLFGGPFGSCQSRGRHFFDEESAAYRELARLIGVRRRLIALRRGRRTCARSPGTASTSASPPWSAARSARWCPGRASSATRRSCARSTPTTTIRGPPG